MPLNLCTILSTNNVIQNMKYLYLAWQSLFYCLVKWLSGFVIDIFFICPLCHLSLIFIRFITHPENVTTLNLRQNFGGN